MSNILTIVKSGALSHTGKILDYFDEVGDRYKTSLVEKVPPELIRAHYSHCINEDYFEAMFLDMLERSVAIALYSHANIEQFLRIKKEVNATFASLVGNHPGYKRTAVHTSDSKQAFIRENDIWKPYL